MNTDKNQWIRFEDGLLNREVVDGELGNQNETAYLNFRKKCCGNRQIKNRRAILIFLGLNSDKSIDSTKELLIDSIMNSCNFCKIHGKRLLTVPLVKCEDSDMVTSAYVNGFTTINWKVVKSGGKDEVKQKLNDGGRVINSGKIALFDRLILSELYLQDQMWNKANRYKKIGMSLIFRVLLSHWYFVLSLVYIVIRYIHNALSQISLFGISVFSIICFLVHIYNRDTIKEIKEGAMENIMEDIMFCQDLNYPVIFYNETGKTKNWMKGYMKSYIRCKERRGFQNNVI